MEQSELPVTPEGELHQVLEEASSIKLTLALDTLKCDEDEEQPHAPELHQRQVKENCDGPEPAQDSSPHGQTDPVDKTGVFSETEDSDGDWRATRHDQSCLDKMSNKLTKFDMRDDTAQKLFSCNECELSFSRRASLKRHLLIHRGDKPHRCSECNKELICYLKKHMAIHLRDDTAQKPLSCSECSQVFVHKDSLIKHKRTHSGEKPFKCSDCGKGFLFKRSLTIHMLSNQEYKPFSCSECGKRFSSMSTRNQHLFVHRVESQFSCSVCNEEFTCERHLKRHVRIHREKCSRI